MPAWPVVLVLLLGGCLSLEPPARLPAPVAAAPAAYPDAGVEGAYEPLRWWRAFGDPVLTRLVDSALAANLDLAEAAARVEEVRAQYRIVRSPLLPGVTASADASYSDGPSNTGTLSFLSRPGRGDSTDAGGGGGTARFSNTTYSASLGFAYELDFWGRVRNDARAALGEAFATEADYHTARLGVLSETIATYFEIVDLRAQIAVLVETIDVLDERVEQTETRYDRGLVSSFELYQVRQDYRNTQASLPQRESQLADAESRLAVLLGRYAGRTASLLGEDLLPRLVFEPIPAGLPAALLVQRPDVRAAAYRLEAARYRIGARRAELFPTLSLSGALGTQGSDAGALLDVLDQWTLNLGAGLTAPLFQAGRLRADVDAAEAQYAQRAAAYARAVLTAYREVAAAMEDYEEQRQRYAFFLAQLDEAEASADLQAARYEAGLTRYTDYLDALRTLYQVQASLSSAGREAALARLAIHRALGGGWTEDGAPPRFELVPGVVPLPEAPRVRSLPATGGAN
ncbi:MAG: TolC family protein [Rhodothermales bacterium]|nr:TolC family protein [Rhodothermales bacterium]